MKCKPNQDKCEDCGNDVKALREYYYHLKPELWLKVAKSSDILCITCLEARFKNLYNNVNFRLNPDDFSNHPMNHKHLRNKSAKLYNRLTLYKNNLAKRS